MSYRLAPALAQLRAQLDAAYPGRDKRSDGWIGDAAHRSRRSDHNPNGAGVVCAIDVDEHDAAGTERVGRELVEALRRGRDPRIAYVIYEGRMFSSYAHANGPAWTWRPGKGHTQHVHVSVRQHADAWDDDRPWDLPGITTDDQLEEDAMRRGDTGNAVRVLQDSYNRFTATHGAGEELEVDGVYGEETEEAVRRYQRGADRPVTGVADGVTLALLLRYSRPAHAHGATSSTPDLDELDKRYARKRHSHTVRVELG